MATEDPRPLTRKELAEFLPNQRAIRAFEKLFDLIPADLVELQIAISEAMLSALDAAAKADAALYDARVISVQVGAYTTATSEKVLAGGNTITLNGTPDDLEFVTVTAATGAVVLDGNGRDISGRPSLTISQQYTSLDIMYSIELDAWFIQ